MAGGAFVIFAGDEVWRIKPASARAETVDELRFERETPVGTIAAAVATRLRERGYGGDGVLLALPAAWCLSAAISTADLPDNDRAAMSFRLEEKLPLAAENFTADFIRHKGEALGVCVANDRIGPHVHALEAAGVTVQAISPAVLLAMQDYSWGQTGTTLLMWMEGDHVNVLRRGDGGGPIAWSRVPATIDDVLFEVELMALRYGPVEKAAAVEFDGEFVYRMEELVDRTSIPIPSRYSGSMMMHATTAAQAALAGSLRLWVDLRQGAMSIEDPLRVVRRPLNATLAAAAVVCVLLAAVFLYRAFRYDRLAQSYESQLVEDFKREFPGWPVPPNVRRMVESERAKVTGGGGPSTSLPAEAQESALRVLHDLLATLPADSKMTVEKIRIADRVAEVEARSKAPEDADVLAAALRAAGFEVPPPQMRRREGVWSFVVHGDKPAKAGAPSQAPAAAAAGGGV
jgi:hypothetical protein